MRIKLLVAAAGFAAFATPSLAAEFYIVQDTTTTVRNGGSDLALDLGCDGQDATCRGRLHPGAGLGADEREVAAREDAPRGRGQRRDGSVGDPDLLRQLTARGWRSRGRDRLRRGDRQQRTCQRKS